MSRPPKIPIEHMDNEEEHQHGVIYDEQMLLNLVLVLTYLYYYSNALPESDKTP